MAIETSAMLSATAASDGWPCWKKKMMKGTLTTRVTARAAERRCIRQKMQPMTVRAT